ncbi:MAG: hypothetical protein ABJL55_21635 [Roseibium sp.]
MMLALAAALLAVFVMNVSMGSFGSAPFLGTVGEMLLLFAVSVTFVIAILQREANR